MTIKDREIHQFLKTLKKYSEYDLNGYSINSLRRRLNKILIEFDDFQDLIQSITDKPEIIEDIIKKITVNTTELFRDPAIWQDLLYRTLPKYQNHQEINIWHPGCSSGQEVYSMMMVLDQIGLLDQANIYASDINGDVLEEARQGIYRLRFNREYVENFNTVFGIKGSDTSEEIFMGSEKYFKIDEARDQIIMHDFLRKKPVYKLSDLVKNDRAFEVKFDFIICRNVIIYFNYPLQNKVLRDFHQNLDDGGCLILGIHESIIGPCTSLFEKDNVFYFKK